MAPQSMDWAKAFTAHSRRIARNGGNRPKQILLIPQSTRPVEITELEPELSVDQLLQDTRENLEEIGFDDRSEARKMIEKFVDEKPEAVATLLRNWLNEDWE